MTRKRLHSTKLLMLPTLNLNQATNNEFLSMLSLLVCLVQQLFDQTMLCKGGGETSSCTPASRPRDKKSLDSANGRPRATERRADLCRCSFHVAAKLCSMLTSNPAPALVTCCWEFTVTAKATCMLSCAAVPSRSCLTFGFFFQGF